MLCLSRLGLLRGNKCQGQQQLSHLTLLLLGERVCLALLVTGQGSSSLAPQPVNCTHLSLYLTHIERIYLYRAGDRKTVDCFTILKCRCSMSFSTDEGLSLLPAFFSHLIIFSETELAPAALLRMKKFCPVQAERKREKLMVQKSGNKQHVQMVNIHGAVWLHYAWNFLKLQMNR